MLIQGKAQEGPYCILEMPRWLTLSLILWLLIHKWQYLAWHAHIHQVIPSINHMKWKIQQSCVQSISQKWTTELEFRIKDFTKEAKKILKLRERSNTLYKIWCWVQELSPRPQRRVNYTTLTNKISINNLTHVVIPLEENLAIWSSKLIPPTPITSIWSAGLLRVLYTNNMRNIFYQYHNF